MPPLARLSGRNQYAPSTEQRQYGVLWGGRQPAEMILLGGDPAMWVDGAMDAPETAGAAKFTIPSIIALVAAVLSFMTGAIGGLILALVAIVFGLIGVLLSFSSKRRGGLVSTLSLLAGFLGIIAAVIKAIAWFF